jgi:glycosyltransferase involved in cell wall biosynthesis
MKVNIDDSKYRVVNFKGRWLDTGVEVEVSFRDFIELMRRYPIKINLERHAYNPQLWQDKKVGFMSPMDFQSGWGNVAYNILKYSRDRGYEVSWVGDLVGQADKLITEACGRDLTPDMAMVWHDQPRAYWHGSPFARNIAVVPFETTQIPRSWLTRLNSFDAVVVPCQQNVQMMKDSGVKVPVEMVHWGIDENKFHYLERNNDVFTFGHMGHLAIRKGTDLLVKAFEKAFPPHIKDVRLICKTTNRSYPFMSHDKRIIVQQPPDLAVPHDELIETFFKKIDCFVYPSRGEGFGFPPLEAMATGVPAITTNWSGMVEYNNNDIGWTLDYKLVPAEEFTKRVYKEDCGNWAEPDFDELVERLRYAYEHQAEVKQRGWLASEFVKNNWLWNQKIGQFHQALNKYL